MTARSVEVIGVSALACLLVVLVAAPVLRAPSERIFGMEIVGRHHDPFTVMEQFDRPIRPAVYLQPLTDVPGALIARASGPVAAYNWLVLLTFPLSAGAAYALARYLSLSPAGAAGAAIAFAFSPFHLAHAAYHPQIAQTQWLPLYFLALWRCLDDATIRAVGFLAVAVAGVALSNFYGGLIAAVLTPIAIGAYWLVGLQSQPRPWRRLAITVGSLSAIGAAGLGYAWYAARPVLVNPSAFGFRRDDLFRYSATWWSYLVPPAAHPLLGGIAKRIWKGGVNPGLLEQQVSLGWGVVALGLVAVFTALRRDRRETSGAIVLVLAAVASGALLCSLAPERPLGPLVVTLPSALLYPLVPMFRSYARFGVVVQLMAVLLAGIGAERLWRFGTRRARVACLTLVTLAAVEYAVWPPALWRDVLPTAADRWIARQPDPVHALDCAPLTADTESVQWLTSGRIAMNQGTWDDCLEANLSDKLSTAGYTHLLVRRDTSEGRWLSARRPPAGLRLAARFDDSDVYAITTGPTTVYTVRMTGFYPREYDEHWTWRWMGPPASWKIVNTSNRRVVGMVDVEMTAFHTVRPLTIRLDGQDVQSLAVEEGRSLTRIGPLELNPGDHELVFRPAVPPTVADAVMHNGDLRPLSFAVGAWYWAEQGSRQ